MTRVKRWKGDAMMLRGAESGSSMPRLFRRIKGDPDRSWREEALRQQRRVVPFARYMDQYGKRGSQAYGGAHFPFNLMAVPAGAGLCRYWPRNSR
jgi:hypothetical protein